MPTMTYDRSHGTNDFEMLDLITAEGLELKIDPTGKVWVNVNGKCLFRAGYVSHITIEDNRKPNNK